MVRFTQRDIEMSTKFMVFLVEWNAAIIKAIFFPVLFWSGLDSFPAESGDFQLFPEDEDGWSKDSLNWFRNGVDKSDKNL